MQTQDIRLTVRVNRELKENAEALFAYLGLNISNAVNIFLRKAVDQNGIPFPVDTDSKWLGGLGVDEIARSFTNAVSQGITQKIKNKQPVARYDIETKRAYLEYANGTREYV